MNPADLSDMQFSVVRDILGQSADRFDKVSVFGSRANGKYRRGSDLDLAIYGADAKICDRLLSEFIDSDLTIEVDVVDYDRINHLPLREQIDRWAKPLFTRDDLLS